MALKQTAPFVLTKRDGEILKAVYFYRYVAALDIAYLLFSPKSLTHVRELLAKLSGGEDFQTRAYLYRFRLPGAGNTERVYTLGSRGRDFLAQTLGLSADWYFRPGKVKHFSHAHVLHSLILTRFLVAADFWGRNQPNYQLTKVRTFYEFEKAYRGLQAIPDGWIEFVRSDGRRIPILLEIDRGREYQQQLKAHVKARLGFITSGRYAEIFGTQAVRIAYVTTGERPEYRETRLAALRRWTGELLAELDMEEWGSVFRFGAINFDGVYSAALFDTRCWFQPYETAAVPLLG